jgi:hypothetical protein
MVSVTSFAVRLDVLRSRCTDPAERDRVRYRRSVEVL